MIGFLKRKHIRQRNALHDHIDIMIAIGTASHDTKRQIDLALRKFLHLLFHLTGKQVPAGCRSRTAKKFRTPSAHASSKIRNAVRAHSRPLYYVSIVS